MPAAEPPRWTPVELARDRELAEARFVLERQGEGPTAFYAAWDVVRPQIEKALALTANLRTIEAQALLQEKGLWQTLRYFCAPPISEEDLWTLVGKKFRNIPPNFAQKTADAFSSVLDHRRSPWIEQGRDPTDNERELSIFSTTVLLAHETAKTRRRGSTSRAQEEVVSEALIAAGVAFDPARSAIERLDELERFSFSRSARWLALSAMFPFASVMAVY